MSDAGTGKGADLAIVGGLLLVLGGGGAWFLLGSGPADDVLPEPTVITSDTGTSNSSNTSITASSDIESAATLLNKARMAVGADMIAEPPGQNALYFYSLALEADPDNTEVQSEFAAVESQVSQSLEEAVANGNFGAAATLAERLSLANPSAPGLTIYYDALEARRGQLEEAAMAAAASGNDAGVDRALREYRDLPGSTESRVAQLNGEVRAAVASNAAARRAAQQQEAEAQAALAAAAQQVASEELAETPETADTAELPVAEAVTEPPINALLRQAEAAMAAGTLFGEGGAQAILTQARRIESGNDQLAGLIERWQRDLEARAQREIAFEQVDDAKLSLAALRDAPGGADIAAPLLKDLALAEATIAARVTPVPAGQLTIREVVQPLYPRSAKRKGLEGWVEVTFTVNTSGRTEDIQVERNSDSDVFDRATIQAVSQWQFEPVEFEGTPIPQRAATRVVFRLAS